MPDLDGVVLLRSSADLPVRAEPRRRSIRELGAASPARSMGSGGGSGAGYALPANVPSSSHASKRHSMIREGAEPSRGTAGRRMR